MHFLSRCVLNVCKQNTRIAGLGRSKKKKRIAGRLLKTAIATCNDFFVPGWCGGLVAVAGTGSCGWGCRSQVGCLHCSARGAMVPACQWHAAGSCRHVRNGARYGRLVRYRARAEERWGRGQRRFLVRHMKAGDEKANHRKIEEKNDKNVFHCNYIFFCPTLSSSYH